MSTPRTTSPARYVAHPAASAAASRRASGGASGSASGGASGGASGNGSGNGSGRTPGRALRTGLRLLFAGLVVSAVAGLYAGASFVQSVEDSLPSLPADPAATLAQVTRILAADGSELGRMFDQRREWANFEDISPLAVNAVVAVEDHRFYEHDGVDVRRILGAGWSTLRGRRQGASTLPMQLSRNYFPSIAEQPLAERKVAEALMAGKLTAAFSKQELLEWYLNTVSFGNNSFGIEAAARRYFSVSAADLSLGQAALLVGILNAPTRYDPFRRPREAVDRRNLVLQRMAETGAIDAGRARKASIQPLALEPSIDDPAASIAPHFVDHVRRRLREWARTSGYDPDRDGLTVHTTLDPRIQRLAEEAVRKQLAVLQHIVDREWGLRSTDRARAGEPIGNRAFSRTWQAHQSVEADFLRQTPAYRAALERGATPGEAFQAVLADAAVRDSLRLLATQLQSGLVVVDTNTGSVRAWVGGLNYRQNQFDNVASARRQPGSTFKPFVYAAALENGFSPYYMVQDRIRSFRSSSRGDLWTPTNSGGGASGRLYTLRQGLAWSKNTVSAHLMARLGPQRIIDTAQSMGIESEMLPVPSLALGTEEVTLLELVSAYATIARMGRRIEPSVIARIEDRRGNTVAEFGNPAASRAISPQSAYTLIDMMRMAVNQGTGGWIRSRFGVRSDLIGKTGTTQHNADGWFVAVHPDLAVGAWVGFNDQRITFESNYWGQGGHNALLLVGEFLRQAERGAGSLQAGPLLSANARFRRPPGYRPPEKPTYSVQDTTKSHASNTGADL